VHEDNPATPGSAVVARRAVCLLALQLRCIAELQARRDLMEAMADWRGIEEWVARDVEPDLCADEREVILAAIGGCPTPSFIDATWRAEALGVLLWSLGAIDSLPPFDTKFDIDELLDRAPGLAEVQSFVDRAELRRQGEIADAEERASHWLWRLRSMPHYGKSLMSPTVRQANAGYADNWPDDVAEGDLAAFGGPVFRLDLDSSELRALRSIVEERCRALRWLARGGSWEDVDMSS